MNSPGLRVHKLRPLPLQEDNNFRNVILFTLFFDPVSAISKFFLGYDSALPKSDQERALVNQRARQCINEVYGYIHGNKNRAFDVNSFRDNIIPTAFAANDPNGDATQFWNFLCTYVYPLKESGSFGKECSPPLNTCTVDIDCSRQTSGRELLQYDYLQAAIGSKGKETNIVSSRTSLTGTFAVFSVLRYAVQKRKSRANILPPLRVQENEYSLKALVVRYSNESMEPAMASSWPADLYKVYFCRREVDEVTTWYVMDSNMDENAGGFKTIGSYESLLQISEVSDDETLLFYEKTVQLVRVYP